MGGQCLPALLAHSSPEAPSASSGRKGGERRERGLSAFSSAQHQGDSGAICLIMTISLPLKIVASHDN